MYSGRRTQVGAAHPLRSTPLTACFLLKIRDLAGSSGVLSSLLLSTLAKESSFSATLTILLQFMSYSMVPLLLPLLVDSVIICR